MIINNSHYTDEQISDALRGVGGSRSVSFRYVLLDYHDIKIGDLESVEQARIAHGEFYAIKRKANFTLNESLKKEINFLTDRIQPWFVLHMQGGGTVEWPLGVFLLESPTREMSGTTRRREIGAYDKSLILQQYKLPARQYFPKSTKYVAAIEQLIAMAGITSMSIKSNESTFLTDKEFPIGTSALEAVNELLGAINYTTLSVDNDGYVVAEQYILPAWRTPTAHYSTEKDSIIAPRFVDELDIATRANVFIRVAENLETEKPLSSVYENNNPSSSISIMNRKRRIMDFGTVNNISSQEILDNLVKRIAIESTSAYRHFEFSTLLMPNHGSADTLYIDIPEMFDTPMKFSETDWEMELAVGGLMKHEARVVVDL